VHGRSKVITPGENQSKTQVKFPGYTEVLLWVMSDVSLDISGFGDSSIPAMTLFIDGGREPITPFCWDQSVLSPRHFLPFSVSRQGTGTSSAQSDSIDVDEVDPVNPVLISSLLGTSIDERQTVLAISPVSRQNLLPTQSFILLKLSPGEADRRTYRRPAACGHVP